ncbi:pentapeptide repeat-containing protein [Clostridium estertheticum]|uniref:pentapeptide repeat-containing protein n=1 Tax=Clostridium estertheticum TaxID=238834 RepID=UPI001C0B49E3|nr:pentapeptide repeat-containing protein [Clostridium estertheticum]MBU3213840.1 pentapeptide repeat-containing protein [Clostridium estertheticum]WAG53720.1 pentapeptide repeat-containing protein [Clostridium estertheticum]
MIYPQENKYDQELSGNNKESLSSIDTSIDNLRVDCKKCFGLCCVALYFSASEGFPIDKDAGRPCINLQSDFNCSVHKNLRDKGLKGCTAYDCFGAGQKVAQVTYSGHDWRLVPESAKQMFEVFLIMRQLHEMLWYLTEASELQVAHSVKDKLSSIINESIRLTHLSPDSLIGLDVESHRDNVNILLLKTSELVRAKACRGQKNPSKHQKTKSRGADLIGADLRKTNLRGANLRGACLIAANLREVDLSGADLIGADLRDTDIRGANLTDSIFLTQSQINTAKGDSNTKLPILLTRPMYWSK